MSDGNIQLNAVMSANFDKLFSELDRLSSELQSLDNNGKKISMPTIDNSNNSKIKDIGQNFKDTGLQISNVGNTIASATSGMHQFASDGLSAASRIKTAQNKMFSKADISPIEQTKSEYKSIIKEIEDVAINGMLTIEDMYSGTTELFGVDKIAQYPEVLKNMIKPMSDLATMSGVSAESAANFLTKTASGFGYISDNADETTGHLLEINATIAKIDSDSIITFSDISESMKYTSATARNYGISLAEVAAATKFMGDAGVRGGRAGSNLAQAFKQMYSPTDKARKVMEQYGISMYDSNGNAKSFTENIEQLRSKLSGLSDEAKNKALDDIFGQQSKQALLPLIQLDEGEFARYKEELAKLTGEKATQVIETKMEIVTDGNIELKLQSVSEKLELVKSKFFKGSAPYLEVVDKALGAILKILDKIPDEVLGIGGMIMLITSPVSDFVGNLGMGIFGMGQILKMFSLVGSTSTAVGATVSSAGAVAGVGGLLAVAGWVLLIVLFGLIVAGIWYMATHFENFGEWLTALVTNFFKVLLNIIMYANAVIMGGIFDAIKFVIGLIVDFVYLIGDLILTALEKCGFAVDGFRNAWKNLYNGVKGWLDKIGSGIQWLFKQIDKLKKALSLEIKMPSLVKKSPKSGSSAKSNKSARSASASSPVMFSSPMMRSAMALFATPAVTPPVNYDTTSIKDLGLVYNSGNNKRVKDTMNQSSQIENYNNISINNIMRLGNKEVKLITETITNQQHKDDRNRDNY